MVNVFRTQLTTEYTKLNSKTTSFRKLNQLNATTSNFTKLNVIINLYLNS